MTKESSIFNPRAREHGGGGYRELEVEIIEKSVNEFIREKTAEERMEAADHDPRIMATIVEMEAQGFDMFPNETYSVR